MPRPETTFGRRQATDGRPIKRCGNCEHRNEWAVRVCRRCGYLMRPRPKRKKTTSDETKRKENAKRAAKHLRQIKVSMTAYTKAIRRERYYALKIAAKKTTTPGALRALDLEEE